MSNHSIDCDFCGNDLRREWHDNDCPAQAYEKARDAHYKALQEYTDRETALYRALLASAEKEAQERFNCDNPPPPRPKRVWEMRAEQQAQKT